MNKMEIVCPCLFGLESVLSGEIKRMGVKEVTTSDGRVSFFGDEHMLARANINLRTAERVMINLGSFRAETFDQLFEGTKALPFEAFISKHNAFPVKGWSINSRLTSIPDCQSIIKKAAVTRLQQKYSVSWFEETEAPVQIRFSIHKDIASVMLDTSGAGLHKRGYRQNSLVAPIKETLAAGILDIARIYPDTVLYDPFCGSGTFSIEAALKAFNIPAGINRKFAAEKWDCLSDAAWREERARGLDLIRRDATFKAYASDIDPDAVELTAQNAKKAGVAMRIKTTRADIADFSIPNDKHALVVCNPPYGERLLEVEQAQKLYNTMGKRFNLKSNNRFFIISPDEKFEKFFGQKADKQRKLYNGMIKCRLYMYR